jgi:hypothetical protein
MHQHLKVNELVAAAYAAVPTLPPAEAKLMREVTTRLSVTFTALTESLEQRKAITAERDEKNKQAVDMAVENAALIRFIREDCYVIAENDDLHDAADYISTIQITDAASLSQLYVKMPAPMDVKMGGDAKTKAMFSGMNMMLDDCKKAIRAAGGTVEGGL